MSLSKPRLICQNCCMYNHNVVDACHGGKPPPTHTHTPPTQPYGLNLRCFQTKGILFSLVGMWDSGDS